jgi:NTP pyrophosphatase (non-canonical NTP hydrolase)
MDFDELLSFIKAEDERLRKHYGYPDEEKRALARTVKVAEEFGELCNEVLAANSLQRKQKLDNHEREKLDEEFADVLFSTLLLASAMNVNIEKAIKNKMEKIKARKY